MHDVDQHVMMGDEDKAPLAPSGNGRQRFDLAESFFAEAAGERLRILVCVAPGSVSAELQSYAEYLTALLHGCAEYRQAGLEDDVPNISGMTDNCDLLVIGQPEQSLLERLLSGPVSRRVAYVASTNSLIVRRPRRPIQRVLLVVRVEELEESAVDWAGRIACASDSHLTILPLVPAQPLMFGVGSGLQVGIESLLTPNTPCGERLRAFLHRLERWHVSGTLRVRQGDPLHQIYWEIDEGAYDLVIIGADQSGRKRRWLFGDLVGPLISRVNIPLLICSMKKPGISRGGR